MSKDDTIKKIYDRFKDDAAGFCSAFTNVFRDTDGTKQELYKQQVNFLNHSKQGERIVVVVKTRQCGISTAIKGRALHRAFFGKVPNILICSASHMQSIKLLREMKEAVYSMPEFIRPEISKDNEQEMHFSSGTKIISLPSNPATVRGWSAEIFLDEYGLLSRKDSEAMWEAISPSLIKGWNLTAVSTPRGKDNLFYDLCNPRLDSDGNIIGVRADKIMKINWWDVPHVKKAVEEMDLMNKMPYRSFLQEFCCEFLDSEDNNLFDSELVDGKFFDKGMELLDLKFLDFIEGPEIESDLILDIKKDYDYIYIGYDPAISAAKDSDGSAVVIFGVKNDEWQLLFVRNLPKGMSQAKQCEYISRLALCVRADKIGFDFTGGMGHTFKERLQETPISSRLFDVTFTPMFKQQEYMEIKHKIESHKMKSPENSDLRKQMLSLGYNPVTGKIAAIGSWRTSKDDLISAILCAHAARAKKNNSGFSIIRVR